MSKEEPYLIFNTSTKASDSWFWNWVGLFFPAPIMAYYPLFTLFGWGFGFSVSIGKYIPLGWAILLPYIILSAITT